MARKEVDTEAADKMEEPTEALVPAGSGAVTTVGTMDLNMDLGDIPLPILKIAYGVGRLSESFNPGDLILGDDNLIAHKGESVEVIVLTLRQYWKEYLTNDMFQAGMIPRTFDTKEEVIAESGTVEFQGDAKPTFSRAVDLRLLIKKPDDLECGIFGLDLPDGGVYAPAWFSMDKTAYRRAGAGLITTCAVALRGNLLSGRFALSTKSEKIGTNMTVVPTVKLLAERNKDEVQAAIQQLFSKNG